MPENKHDVSQAPDPKEEVLNTDQGELSEDELDSTTGGAITPPQRFTRVGHKNYQFIPQEPTIPVDPIKFRF